MPVKACRNADYDYFCSFLRHIDDIAHPEQPHPQEDLPCFFALIILLITKKTAAASAAETIIVPVIILPPKTYYLQSLLNFAKKECGKHRI